MGKKFISYVMTAVLLVCSVLPHIGVTSVHAAVSNPNVNYLNNSAYASVHDPTILKEGNTYYMYSTGIIGQGVELRTSTDMIHWTYVSDFANKHNSSLKTSAVMAATGNSMTNIWAPNVLI